MSLRTVCTFSIVLNTYTVHEGYASMSCINMWCAVHGQWVASLWLDLQPLPLSPVQQREGETEDLHTRATKPQQPTLQPHPSSSSSSYPRAAAARRRRRSEVYEAGWGEGGGGGGGVTFLCEQGKLRGYWCHGELWKKEQQSGRMRVGWRWGGNGSGIVGERMRVRMSFGSENENTPA